MSWRAVLVGLTAWGSPASFRMRAMRPLSRSSHRLRILTTSLYHCRMFCQDDLVSFDTQISDPADRFSGHPAQLRWCACPRRIAQRTTSPTPTPPHSRATLPTSPPRHPPKTPIHTIRPAPPTESHTPRLQSAARTRGLCCRRARTAGPQSTCGSPPSPDRPTVPITIEPARVTESVRLGVRPSSPVSPRTSSSAAASRTGLSSAHRPGPTYVKAAASISEAACSRSP